MGYKNKKYSKSLYEQANEKFVGMQCFGQSKRQAMEDGSAHDKIFSINTYKTYWKQAKYFLDWLKEKHPEITTLKKARKYANEWLQENVDAGLSAWTIQTRNMALCKLFGKKETDDDWFEAPKRNRTDIKRSRVSTARDRHFSKTNNDELIKFCESTGCRRNILKKLNKEDLIKREDIEKELKYFKSKTKPTDAEMKHIKTLEDALEFFPDYDYFIHHIKDKGGRERYSPVLDRYRDIVLNRFEKTEPGKKVWGYVHTDADIHGYRANYATELYKKYARPIEELPVVVRNGKKYKPDLYVCRNDEKGKKLDRRAMLICSKALGHNRVSVVADNYIRGL